MVGLVARFVDERVAPRVREFESVDEYPEAFIEEMKELGFFGLLVPAEHGGADVSAACFARVTEELARGWMSLAGAIGGHSVISYLIRTFGTDDQQRTYLPAMAEGRVRATMALTEPAGGSDLQAMRTHAAGRRRRAGHHRVEDVDLQRPALRAHRPAVQDRPHRRAGPPRDERRARRAGGGADRLGQDPEARLPGRRGVRALLRRDAGAGLRRPRGRARAGLGAHDARPRGRPDPGRRAGGRGGPGGAAGRAPLRPGPRDLRQAHLAAPVGGQPARRHGHQDPGRPRS